MKRALVIALLLMGATSLGAGGRLVVANTPEYTTAAAVAAKPALAAERTVAFSNCNIWPRPEIQLVPGGGGVVRGVGSGGCFPAFALFEIPDSLAALIDVETVITFDDGVTEASFQLGLVGSLKGDEVVRIRWRKPGDMPIINDAEEDGYVTVVPVVANTPFLVTLHDASSEGRPPVTEFFRGDPPIAQHRIVATGSFWIDVQLGYGIPAPFGCWPLTCDQYGEVFGFAHTSRPTTTNFRAMVFPVD